MSYDRHEQQEAATHWAISAIMHSHGSIEFLSSPLAVSGNPTPYSPKLLGLRGLRGEDPDNWVFMLSCRY
jgi:hypothetical protein